MERTITDYARELLAKVIDNYNKEEPINASSLNSTLASGIAAIASAVGAGVGSIFAATNGARASVVIATLAVVAVSVLALALIIRSDHQSRTAVTLDMIKSLPELIAAAHESEAPPTTGVPGRRGMEPFALGLPDGPGSDGNSRTIPVNLRVRFKGDEGPSKVIAVKTSTKPELFALRPGSVWFDWTPKTDEDKVVA